MPILLGASLIALAEEASKSPVQLLAELKSECAHPQPDMSLHDDSVEKEPGIGTDNDLTLLKERQRHVSDHPDDAEGYYSLATSYWKLSKKGSDKEKADEAIEAVKKAIELTPDVTFVTVKAHYLLTEIYRMSGEHDKSLEWKQRRVILERKWKETKHRVREERNEKYAKQRKELQNRSEAILEQAQTKEKGERLEEKENDVSKGCLSLAMMYWDSSAYGLDKQILAQAIGMANKAIELSPTSDSAYILMSLIAVREQGADEAIEWLEKGLAQTNSVRITSRLEVIKGIQERSKKVERPEPY